VDRCALFVDAGYVLADGAMAVHGTRRRESVSWDYEGLLQLLAGLARERSGLPLLRCYWYEGSVEGRRTTDHDALADLPGVKLRLSKTRPGREGVESEIHRDLTALARNQAVSDAMVVSAEEELAQVVADVQDLGMRVTLLHIAVDGNWTISRTLRQESDDIVEISAADLRPFVELIPGAEPARADEQGGGALIPLHPQANGHLPGGRTAPYAPIPVSSGNGHQAPPAIYTAPVVAEYQRSAPQLPRHVPDEPAVSYDRAPYEQAARYEEAPADERDHQQPAQPASQAGKSAQAAQAAQQEIPLHPDQHAPWQDNPPARQDLFAALAERPARRQEAQDARQELTASPQETPPAQEQQVRQELPAARLDQQPARTDVPPAIDPATRPGLSARPGFAPRPDLYGAPVAAPAPAPQDDRPADLPAAARPRLADVSGYNPGAMREPLAGEDGLQPVPVASGSAQIRRLPTRGNGPSAPSTGYPPHAQPSGLQPSGPQPGAGQPVAGQPGMAQSGMGQSGMGQPGAGQLGLPPLGQPGNGQPAAQPPIDPGAGQPSGSVTPIAPTYTPARNGSYSGPQPVVPSGPQSGPIGLVGQPGSPFGQPGSAQPGLGQPGLGQPGLGQPGLGQPGLGQPGLGQAAPGQHAPGQSTAGQPAAGQVPPAGQVTPLGGPAGPGGPAAAGGVPGSPAASNGNIVGQGAPGFAPPAGQPGLSLADAVQAAHEEGQEFGGSVARDAPALWLEAVLARKPRMPSDLEARLLQGSSLPIDFLLHDEVRHALRRGFWDALERARR
jgi:NYN domain